MSVTLREFINRHFDLEELRTLCFDLGVQYDDLRGEGRAARVRELIALMARLDRLEELVGAVQRARPQAFAGSDVIVERDMIRADIAYGASGVWWRWLRAGLLLLALVVAGFIVFELVAPKEASPRPTATSVPSASVSVSPQPAPTLPSATAPFTTPSATSPGAVLALPTVTPSLAVTFTPAPSVSLPFQVYQVGTQPSIEPVPGSWFFFADAPEPDQPIYFESFDAYGEAFHTLMPEYVPISFDGQVHLAFDIESVVERYQININSVSVEVETNPLDDVVDIYFFPPELGGGFTREYVLDLSSTLLGSTRDGIQVYDTVLRSGGEAVDYIFLSPGERESLEITVRLGAPGDFLLTPIVNYAYRQDFNSVRTSSFHVVYPLWFRTWHFDQNPRSCSKQGCTGGDGYLLTHSIEVNTQSNDIQMPYTSTLSASPCLSSSWIAFESSMVTFGYLQRPFLIKADGTGLRLLGSRDLHVPSWMFKWTEDSQLIVAQPGTDNQGRQYTLVDVKMVDPSSGRIESLTADQLSAEGFGETANWFGAGPGNGVSDLAGVLDKTVPLGKDESRRYLSLSPQETRIAFVQGKGLGGTCSPRYLQNVFVIGTDGSGLRQLTSGLGWYRNPAWSPDGRYIAFEAGLPAYNGGELKCFAGIYHIHVIDVETGREYQLTSGPLNDYGPTWSEDGEWVLAGGDRLSLSRWDGSSTQDVFVPPAGGISHVSMQP